MTQKQQITVTCPRGRTTRRTVTGRGRIQIRRSCGCGFVQTVQVR